MLATKLAAADLPGTQMLPKQALGICSGLSEVTTPRR
jgi:hypothetical protein